MKINPSKAIQSIIDGRTQKDKIFNSEQKIIAERVAKIQGKQKQDILTPIKKISKNDSAAFHNEVATFLKDTVKALDKVKHPKMDHSQSPLSIKAAPFLNNSGQPGTGTGKFNDQNLVQPHDKHIQEDTTANQCFTSAIKCYGSFCDVNTSSIFPFFQDYGEGGELGTDGSGGHGDEYNSLFFLYVPPGNGTASVTADVILTGDVSASTHPRHTNFPGEENVVRARASAQFGLYLNVYQLSDQLKTSFTQLVDFNNDGVGQFNIRRFRSERVTLQIDAVVSSDFWYLFEVQAWGHVYGRSALGMGLVNFKKGETDGSGLAYGITVPTICAFFDSPAANP